MRLTELAHDYLNATLQPGDHAIDATAGNGHDSCHLAKRIGPTGKLIAIDIQQAAITATAARLEAAGDLVQSDLIVGNHSEVLQALCPEHANTVTAITFNLGYLPGSNKSIQTEPESTLEALRASSELLKTNGLLLVTAYRGHDGGQTEAHAVAQWMNTIQSRGWSVKSHEPIVNSGRIPPILWVAQKA